jgi:hypothetical protein
VAGRLRFAQIGFIFHLEDIGMNRTILFGVAIFFAFVAIALIGGDAQVIAGHGCHGCSGAKRGAKKCDGATLTKTRCHGSKKSHGSKRCSGSKAKGEIAPPPPKETRVPRLRRAPLVYYRVSYR